MSQINYTKHKVIRLKDLTPDTFELVLDRKGLKFNPGDCLLIRNLEGETRPYFIASGVQEAWIRLIIRKVQGSPVVEYIQSLNPGNMIKVNREPFSVLPQLINADKDDMFIVSEVGIAPILSYLSTFTNDRAPNIYYLVNKEGVNQEWLRNVHGAKIYTSCQEMVHDIPVNKKHNYIVVGYESSMNIVLDRLKGRVKDRRISKAIFSRS